VLGVKKELQMYG